MNKRDFEAKMAWLDRMSENCERLATVALGAPRPNICFRKGLLIWEIKATRYFRSAEYRAANAAWVAANPDPAAI